MYENDFSMGLLIRFNKNLEKVCFMLELTLGSENPKTSKSRLLPGRTHFLAM